MKRLWKYKENFGRMGSISSVFVATDEQITAAMEYEVYFGEALGKHSEIYTKLTSDNLTCITDDQDFIEKAIKYKMVPVGHNPLNHLLDEDGDEVEV